MDPHRPLKFSLAIALLFSITLVVYKPYGALAATVLCAVVTAVNCRWSNWYANGTLSVFSWPAACLCFGHWLGDMLPQ
jgi:hypothetical protein